MPLLEGVIQRFLNKNPNAFIAERGYSYVKLGISGSSKAIIIVSISQGEDDGYVQNSFGIDPVDTTSLNILVKAGTSGGGTFDTSAGLLFQSVGLEQGATILGATVTVYAHPALITVSIYADIWLELSENSVGFPNNEFWDDRPQTARVLWDQIGVLEGEIQSPEIGAIVQELVNLPDWTETSPIFLTLDSIVYPDGVAPGERDFRFTSFDNDTQGVPAYITIEYDSGVTPPLEIIPDVALLYLHADPPTVEINVPDIFPDVSIVQFLGISPIVGIPITPGYSEFLTISVECTVEYGSIEVQPDFASLDLAATDSEIILGAVDVIPTIAQVELRAEQSVVEYGTIEITIGYTQVPLEASVDVSMGALEVIPDPASIVLMGTEPVVETIHAILIPGLTCWLDGADEGAQFIDTGFSQPISPGDFVGGFQDKSGNNIHAIMETSSRRPKNQPNGQNSKSTLKFDGVDDLLQRANTLLSDIVSADECTVFVAVAQYSPNNIFYLVNAPDNTNRISGTPAWSSNIIYFDHGNISSGAGGRVQVDAPPNWREHFHIIEFYRNGGLAEIWVDGVTLLSDPSGFFDLLDVTRSGTLLFSGDNEGTVGEIDFGDFVCYNRALEIDERNRARN